MELKIEDLTKEFKEVRAVDCVSYTMHNGVYGLLGANGAGKTTFMRMLCTLLTPTGGRITCNGEDIFEMGARYRKLLGYLPQEFGFYPEFSVRDYLLYIASIKGIKTAAAKRKADRLIREVGLLNVRDRKMKKLSGGMKRRAGIAQALLNDPQILILDEPTAGLDPSERIRFRNLLSGLGQDRLILLSTHIVSDVASIAGEILLMKEGKMIHTGSPEEVIAAAPVKVYQVLLQREEADGFLKGCRVANLKMEGETMLARVLAEERPCQKAREESLTLEDVFLYYFGEKAGEEDAVL